MADNNVTDYPRALHPLHAILLAFPLPLFLGALLSDLAYSSTYEVQWTNFASWLIAGAMLTGALVTLWALVECVVSCLLYTSPSPRDATLSRMPSSA